MNSGNSGNSKPGQSQEIPQINLPNLSKGAKVRLWIIGTAVFVIYLLLQFGVTLYTDFLWFQHLNLESVFFTSLWAKILVGVAVGLPFAVLFWVNTFIARWQSVRNILFFSDEILVAQLAVKWAIFGVGLFLAWVVGVAASNNWLMFLRFLNQQVFGLVDPTLGMDVGFYVFILPLLHFIQSWLIVALFLSLMGSVGVYALAQQNNLAEGRVVVLPHVQLHLSVIGILIFLAFAWGHWLDLFDLMYSTRGVAFGASYTDINVTMPALRVMIVVALTAALILFVNIFLRKPALSLFAIFVWIIIGIIGTGLIPGLVQRYAVEPNELAREAPYIQNNIEFTNIAYGLDQAKEFDVVDIDPLTAEAITQNESILQNIRLWDYRPLQQTYKQLQSIRLYYDFYNVDFDRYMVNDQLRQVALSGRELDKQQLQSPTWVTQKMQFTHGYGAVVNPVNEATGDGLPQLWVKDLPPQSSIDLEITRPEIYYGEATSDYVFVNTQEREFNYPSGEENEFTNYSGTGGVVLNNLFKKLAFALRLADTNMLLSSEFTPESRVLLHRDVASRVRKIAPFLKYDNDPYLVVADDGHLYWIYDAYTITNLFPYAEPIGGFNYIRNSVKVVIDAYDGSLIFYTSEPDDPLIKSYQAIFPALFTPMSQMPTWTRAHLRYPEDLFRVQSRLYQTYHMRDTNVFYNKEDLWQIPKETISGGTQDVEPYYVILNLPNQTKSEFVLIQPFTPNNKDNLIAWMAARSDGENYGQLVTYRFPKQELIFGPLQIEARIDQNPDISAQITLWDQGGSEVIRGNLLVLPIENSLLYVEPLYLQAENGQIPELKRVILASENKIVMEETLAEALLALFDDETPIIAEEPATTAEESATEAETADSVTSDTDLSGETIAQLAQRASDHYNDAQSALRRGDWATYGAELEQMEAVLNALIALTAESE